MSYKNKQKRINEAVFLQKNKSTKVIVKEFRPDFLRDKLLLELIEGWRKLKTLKETFEGMREDLIPVKKMVEMKGLELYVCSISNLMVA